MALPTSKQSHKEHPPTWNSPFAPEWPHWNRNRIDMFGESIHTRHQANFQKLLSVVKRNRPVQRTEFGLRYARGHLRQKGQKLWLPYAESVEHTREHAFPEALPDDHVLTTLPISELWAAAENTRVQFFPRYQESAPRYGLNHTTERDRHSDLNGYYLSDYGVIQVAYGRINRLMPYDAINLQVHEFESKLVWKSGASQRLDLAQYVFDNERNLTKQDWETAAHNPEQFINNIRDGFMHHSGGHWTNEHELMLTDLLRDTFANRIKWAIEATQHGREPHNKMLNAAVNNLYTFEPPTEPTWDSYQEFLNSPEWQAKRQEVIKRSGGWCEFCKVAGIHQRAAHVHHVHYKKPWGQEDPTDLLHLCEAHHKIAHGNTRP